jgi:hypothetical protein
VEFAVNLLAPEFQEFVQLREFRGDVQVLPDEGLQDGGVVRQVVQDFGGGQAIITQLQGETHQLCSIKRLLALIPEIHKSATKTKGGIKKKRCENSKLALNRGDCCRA